MHGRAAYLAPRVSAGPGRARVRAAAAAVSLALALLVPAAGAPAQERPPEVEFLDAGTVLPSDLPFSEAVRVGGTLYLSGMVGVVPGTDSLVAGGIAPETRRTMRNIRAVLRAHGSSLSRVVKCTVFLDDIGEWDAFNEIYRGFFSDPYPARSALGADGLALGAAVEVECLAAAGPESGTRDGDGSGRGDSGRDAAGGGGGRGGAP